jgi:DNA ligase (NAD+)
MAEKSAINLLDSIEVSKGQSLDRLLNGLGISMVGEVAANQLAERYNSLEEFASLEPEREREELAQIHGIGPKIAGSVAEALIDPSFLEVVKKLLTLGIDPKVSSQSSGSGIFAGRSFCVTGTLSKPRPEIHEIITEQGGEVHKAVKKGTKYLVTGQKVGKSKIEKAKKTGATVIDEDAFWELLKNGGDQDG